MEESENNIIKRICALAKLARSTAYCFITAEVVADHGVKGKQRGELLVKQLKASGKTIEMIALEKISIVQEMVLEDRRLNIKESAVMSNISETSVRRIRHDHLGMNKISASGYAPSFCSPT